MASKIVKAVYENGDKPKARNEIDKHYVVAYTKAHGTKEQRAAIKQVILDNTVERISNFTKKPYKDVKMGAVRDLFCEFFFPHLNEKPGAKTFEDELDEL